NPFPDDYGFGPDGGKAPGVVYGDSAPTRVTFDVLETPGLTGTVYNDVNQQGRPVRPQYLFDFGTPSSPVQPGYTPVTSATAYSAALGQGWGAGSVIAASSGIGDALASDANFTADGTFLVDVPNGLYDVTLTIGLGGATAQGTTVFLQGLPLETVTTAAGEV